MTKQEKLKSDLCHRIDYDSGFDNELMADDIIKMFKDHDLLNLSQLAKENNELENLLLEIYDEMSRHGLLNGHLRLKEKIGKKLFEK